MFLAIVIIVVASIIALMQNTQRGFSGGDENMRMVNMYGGDKYPIYMNKGSMTWVTPTKTAVLIKKIVDDLLPGNVRLLDMTANCGGNLLPFVDDERYSGVAYEIDPTVFKILEKNTSYFPRRKKWDLRCSSSVKDTETYDIIIADPPFGDMYKKGVVYQPTLGGVNMSELVHMFAKRAKFIVLKLPMVDFDVDGFSRDVPYKKVVYTRDDLNKMDGKNHKIMLIIVEIASRAVNENDG